MTTLERRLVYVLVPKWLDHGIDAEEAEHRVYATLRSIGFESEVARRRAYDIVCSALAHRDGFAGGGEP